MLKLLNLINGNFQDPFTGDVFEGLIRTVDIDKTLELVNKRYSTLDQLDTVSDGKSLIIGFAPKYLEGSAANYLGNYPDNTIPDILAFLNNLGYFPASVEYELNNKAEQYKLKYTPSTFRKLILDQQPTYLIFTFEPKYDPVVKPPRYIYHITDRKYLDSIKKIGLKPKTLNKLSAHESRIYFSISEEAVQKLWSRFKWYIPQDRGVLLTVDTENLDITFYNDPNFDKLGVYTYANISPQHIISYKPLQES